MIKVVIFDLDRTLLDWDRTQEFAKQEVDKLLKNYISPNTFWQAYDIQHDGLWNAYMQNEIDVSEYRLYRYFKPLQQCGIDDRDLAVLLNQTFVQYALQHHYFCQGVEELLNLCQSLGFKMAVLTNGPTQGQYQKIKNLRLERWFDAYFISDEQGTAKPEAQAFLNICQKFNVQPSECLMIGDDLNIDILPAHHLGMQTFWVNHYQAQNHAKFTAYTMNQLTDLIHAEFNFQ